MATGNVVFRQGNNQISADRAEVDTKTGLGTFYNATGFATVKPPRQTVAPGGVALPPRTGEENVVLFFGETVEKIGPRKYKIMSGGFTTCVQPTPRWDMQRRHHRAQPRSLHAAETGGVERQGRAAVLSAGALLPDETRGSRDGVSASDLRDVDAPGTLDTQRVLLGDQSQPGRDHPARLVLEDRSGCRH